MGKHRITDSLSLHVSGEEMPCIIPDIPPNATSLYKQGTVLLLRRPAVISKLNTSVPMGSCTCLVIQQILISSNILWGDVASAALDIVVKFPETSPPPDLTKVVIQTNNQLNNLLKQPKSDTEMLAN